MISDELCVRLRHVDPRLLYLDHSQKEAQEKKAAIAGGEHPANLALTSGERVMRVARKAKSQLKGKGALRKSGMVD